MMSRFSLYCFFLAVLSISNSYSTDLDQVVSGGDVEDSLGKAKPAAVTDPYIINSGTGDVDRAKINPDEDTDYNFKKRSNDLTVKNSERKQLEDVGFTPPGTFEKSENYLELNKSDMAKSFRNKSSGALNISFIKNDYSYESQNDIINRTISEGYKHVKGGTLHFRSDQYFLRRDYLNTYWSLGAGVGYNSGHAIFITGERSDTTFRLWEIPIDAGLGLEIPLYHWFKVAGTAGPSVTALYQNRSDYQHGEKGKNKIQVSYGEFASLQFKFNLTGMSNGLAYDLFSESKITNLLMNIEMRYHNYQNFQDDIKVSGASFGLGFTFEYL